MLIVLADCPKINRFAMVLTKVLAFRLQFLNVRKLKLVGCAAASKRVMSLGFVMGHIRLVNFILLWLLLLVQTVVTIATLK